MLGLCPIIQQISCRLPLEEEVEHRAVILISPDQDLRYGPDGLHQQALVALRHCLVLTEI